MPKRGSASERIGNWSYAPGEARYTIDELPEEEDRGERDHPFADNAGRAGPHGPQGPAIANMRPMTTAIKCSPVGDQIRFAIFVMASCDG